MKKELTGRTEILVRFNEADPLGIVWHGHYIRYFEDGREEIALDEKMTFDLFKYKKIGENNSFIIYDLKKSKK